jgi:hypothetical protein
MLLTVELPVLWPGFHASKWSAPTQEIQGLSFAVKAMKAVGHPKLYREIISPKSQMKQLESRSGMEGSNSRGYSQGKYHLAVG